MIRISDKALCCGCTACMSICPKNCIEMQKDDNGFNFMSYYNELYGGDKTKQVLNNEKNSYMIKIMKK